LLNSATVCKHAIQPAYVEMTTKHAENISRNSQER